VTIRRFYEAMFLVDSNWATTNWQETLDTVTNVVQRYDGKIRRIEKWGDRKLAYPIRIERTVHRRGTYLLLALELPTGAPNQILHDLQLDPRFLRTLTQVRRDDEIDKIFDVFPAMESLKRRRDGEELPEADEVVAEAEGEGR